MMRYITASAAYPIDTLSTPDAIWEKWESWLAEAASAGAQLAVFPEYGAIEAAYAIDRLKASDLQSQLDLMTAFCPSFIKGWQRLSRRYAIHVLAPSLPYRAEHGQAYNRAFFFGPDGAFEFQDKMIPTPFEREAWALDGGRAFKVFETTLGRIAILICYDCEFPLLARAAVEAGAQLLVVPSCTDCIAGYWRVRVAAMARALEGQCFVVLSGLVGSCSWSPSTDQSYGAAGFYGPPDTGFPDDGVITTSDLNKPGWVYSEIDYSKVKDVRSLGAVRPFRDWPEQGGGRTPAAKLVTL